MARKANPVTRTSRRARALPAQKDSDTVLDVTVVLLEAGYASTAIGPIEVFHSAGMLWNWLQGETIQSRFRVRVASIDGAGVTGIRGLGLVPECSIHDVKKTDIIILPASGWDVVERISQNTALLPWLKKWHTKAPTLPVFAPARPFSRNAACWTAGARRRIGRSRISCVNAIPRSYGSPINL
jgi:hypothetical protein